MTTYTDPYLNALMYSHQAVVRAELWFNGVKIEDVGVVDGRVVADRGSTTRRVFNGLLDPRRAPITFADQLAPYGTQIRVYKGLRYPNGDVAEFPVFTGRIDAVDFGFSAVAVRASDRGQDLADARFLAPMRSTKGWTVVAQISALIQDAIPAAVVNDLTGSTTTVLTQATWDRERTEALDNLAQSIGAEWYAGADGQFYIAPLPSIVNNPTITWFLDSGDQGVVIERSSQRDRARIYNAVVVNGEPPDGRAPAYGVATDADPSSPLYFGGPFGKVPKFFSSQFITTDAQAVNTARAMLGDCVCGTRSVTISCVPNAKLDLGDVVEVTTQAGDYDGLYFIHSFSLPLAPEEPMTLACNVALTDDGVFLRAAKT